MTNAPIKTNRTFTFITYIKPSLQASFTRKRLFNQVSTGAGTKEINQQNLARFGKFFPGHFLSSARFTYSSIDLSV